MSKVWNYRFASRAGLLIVAFATVVGCESKGPAERAGASIDKGVQNAKDAINPPGPAEKAGRALTAPANPEPDELAWCYPRCGLRFSPLSVSVTSSSDPNGMVQIHESE